MSTLTTLAVGGTLSRHSLFYRFLAWWYGEAKARSFHDTCELRGALFQPMLIVLLAFSVSAFIISGLVKMFILNVELNGASQAFLKFGNYFLTIGGIASVLVGVFLVLVWFRTRVPKIGKPLANVVLGAVILAALAAAFIMLAALGELVVEVVSSRAPEFERYTSFLNGHPVLAGAAGLVLVGLAGMVGYLGYQILRAIRQAWNAFWSLEDRVVVIAWIKGQLCKRITYIR